MSNKWINKSINKDWCTATSSLFLFRSQVTPYLYGQLQQNQTLSDRAGILINININYNQMISFIRQCVDFAPAHRSALGAHIGWL